MLDTITAIFAQGGVMMYPLLLCSILTLTVAVERLLVLRSKALLPRAAQAAWEEWMQSSMDLDSVPTQQNQWVLGQLLGPLTPYFPIELPRLEERLSDLSRKLKNRLERGVVYLDTIAGIAPLLGLLGTTLGMVEVFAKLSSSGHAKIEALSAGISQALLTTVTGLMIGIPALIAANLFTRHIENLLLRAEDQVNDLLDTFYSKLIKHEDR